MGWVAAGVPRDETVVSNVRGGTIKVLDDGALALAGRFAIQTGTGTK